MLKEIRLLAIAAWFSAAASANAQTAAPGALPAQLSEPAPCVAGAAQYHGVNPWVLRAILKVESDFNPRAVNRNANGSVDVGMAQINSIHFAELGQWGIAPANLMDGCVATYVAAWHLSKQIRKYGNSWFGVASYHSSSPCQNSRYAGLLWNALVGWGAVPGPRLKVSTLRACGYIAPAGAGGKRGTGTRSSPAVAFDEGQ